MAVAERPRSHRCTAVPRGVSTIPSGRAGDCSAAAVGCCFCCGAKSPLSAVAPKASSESFAVLLLRGIGGTSAAFGLSSDDTLWSAICCWPPPWCCCCWSGGVSSVLDRGSGACGVSSDAPVAAGEGPSCPPSALIGWLRAAVGVCGVAAGGAAGVAFAVRAAEPVVVVAAPSFELEKDCRDIAPLPSLPTPTDAAAGGRLGIATTVVGDASAVALVDVEAGVVVELSAPAPAPPCCRGDASTLPLPTVEGEVRWAGDLGAALLPPLTRGTCGKAPTSASVGAGDNDAASVRGAGGDGPASAGCCWDAVVASSSVARCNASKVPTRLLTKEPRATAAEGLSAVGCCSDAASGPPLDHPTVAVGGTTRARDKGPTLPLLFVGGEE